MQMMFAINKDNFDGHREVTCNSCHRGATDPVGTPIIAEEEPRPGPGGPMRPEGASPAANTPAGPSADQLIEKYVEALGGADALQKISSRVEKRHHDPLRRAPPGSRSTFSRKRRTSACRLYIYRAAGTA